MTWSCFIILTLGRKRGWWELAEVVREGYPDYTALDPTSEHPDPRHTEETPIWYMVDVKFRSKFAQNVLLSTIKETPELVGNRLTQKGNRLSVFPVEKKHFGCLVSLGQGE